MENGSERSLQLMLYQQQVKPPTPENLDKIFNLKKYFFMTRERKNNVAKNGDDTERVVKFFLA